jgi:hypothetical protein
MHVAVIDIGSPKKNLGWAVRGTNISDQGADLDLCIDSLLRALDQGPLALGFEAPLFVPAGRKTFDLTKARDGECAGGVNRPFSGGPGTSVLVTALTVVPYVLDRLREGAPQAVATMDWRARLPDNGLLLFEAFVSNQRSASPTRHIDDALLAISAFRRSAADSKFDSAINEPNVFSLLGAMLLRTGWTRDVSVLSKSCLVVKG